MTQLPLHAPTHRRSSSKTGNSFSRARTTSSIPSDLGKISYSSSTQQLHSHTPLLHHGRSHSGSMVEGHMLMSLNALNPNSSYSAASAPHIGNAPASGGYANGGVAGALNPNGGAGNGLPGSFAVINGSSNALYTSAPGFNSHSAPGATAAGANAALLNTPGYLAVNDRPSASGNFAQSSFAQANAANSMGYAMGMSHASSMAHASSAAHSGSFAMSYASTGGLAGSYGTGGMLNDRYGGAGGVSSSAPVNVLLDGPRAPLSERQPVGTTRCVLHRLLCQLVGLCFQRTLCICTPELLCKIIIATAACCLQLTPAQSFADTDLPTLYSVE